MNIQEVLKQIIDIKEKLSKILNFYATINLEERL